ncbi:hypothetical protein ACHQM5_024974 [Ranunculus cassubicifolius]
MASMELLLQLCLVVILLVFGFNGVAQGRINPEGQDITVKTIKTVAGDIYDCVDIKRQPAMDHPMYQNHEIQMKPTSFPESALGDNNKESSVTISTVDCPRGTVPIRRNAKVFSESPAPYNINLLGEGSPGTHYAVGKTRDDVTGTYNGIQGYVSLYSLAVGANQSSSSRVWVENGSGDQLNSLQAGWMVSPQIYGDSQTRLFVYMKSNAPGHGRGCYNHLCNPSFVQVNNNIALDAVLSPTTVPNGQQYIVQLQIFRDTVTGNWWFRFNGADIGYWINTLLPGLQGGASHVAWGGLAQGLPNGPSPPMGSGFYEAFNTKSVAYFRQLKVMDPSSNTWVNPNGDDFTLYDDNRNCYGLDSYGNKDPAVGLIFTFGGPGGNCAN